MTVREQTVCNVIQTFPVLLILAQKHNRCLETPFVYHPPTPTHSPEYYAALESLLHTIKGPNCLNHYPYGYGKNLQENHNAAYALKPCYDYGYPYPNHHDIGYEDHGYPNDVRYPNYTPGYTYKKPHYSIVYKGSNYNVVRSGKGVYNATGVTYKSYAPNQMYNINNKNKIVVRRTHGRKRKEKLQGFFAETSRDERYGTPRKFIREGFQRLLHPFDRRPHQHEDRFQYGRQHSDRVVFPTSKPINRLPVEDPKSFDRPINSNDVIIDNPVVFPGHEKEELQLGDKGGEDPVNFEKDVPIVEISSTTQLTPVPTLPPLTPATVRSNFNFGSEGLFKETCTTIDNEIGSCIRITDCEPLLDIVKKVQSGAAARNVATDMLRRAHCGFDGNTAKVCCPRPGIPTSAPPDTTLIPTTKTTTTTTTTTEAPQPKSEDYSDIFPEPPVCGVGNFSGFRVVGGEDAKLGAFPWMALLGYNRRGSTRWLCGGSLITSKHILTAAHCIYNHETELYLVRLGELDYTTEADGAHPIDVPIKQSIRHEGYDPKSLVNDVGVLVLTGEVQFSDLIRPICMPMDGDLRARSYENYMPIVAGWGNINYQGPASPRLQWVQLPVVGTTACANKFAAHKAQVIDARVLCAGAGGGKDACRGDSGGPLIQPIYNPSTLKTFMYQIGVVSYGKGCAFEDFPGVYSRVTHFIPWIQEQVAKSTTTR